MEASRTTRGGALAGALARGLALGVACSACDGPMRASADPASERGRAALAAWASVVSVLQHPRCANCHPPDRVPRQGDDRREHSPTVHGGATGRGRHGVDCTGCHRDYNLGPAPLAPGAPDWRMPAEDAPLVFTGRSSAELCRQLQDPRRNGGRTLEALYEHAAHDPLVRWGFAPGEGRTSVPLTHDEFLRALRAWIDNGCGCPP